MPFKIWERIIRTRGFYIISKDTLVEIQNGCVVSGVWTYPCFYQFEKWLKRNGYTYLFLNPDQYIIKPVNE